MEINLVIKSKSSILTGFAEVPRIGEKITVDNKKYTIVDVEWVTNTYGIEDAKRLKKVIVYAKEKLL